jgi:hypothetical protein
MFNRFRKRKESQKASAEGLTQEGSIIEGMKQTSQIDYKTLESIARGVVDFYVLIPPVLPQPFAALFDFCELVRTADESRKTQTLQQRESTEPRTLRSFLLSDVTRLEELLLTKELLRIGRCYVELPLNFRGTSQKMTSRRMLLHFSGQSLSVEFSCL